LVSTYRTELSLTDISFSCLCCSPEVPSFGGRKLEMLILITGVIFVSGDSRRI